MIVIKRGEVRQGNAAHGVLVVVQLIAAATALDIHC